VVVVVDSSVVRLVTTLVISLTIVVMLVVAELDAELVLLAGELLGVSTTVTETVACGFEDSVIVA
jgi:hypothetical protein